MWSLNQNILGKFFNKIGKNYSEPLSFNFNKSYLRTNLVLSISTHDSLSRDQFEDNTLFHS